MFELVTEISITIDQKILLVGQQWVMRMEKALGWAIDNSQRNHMADPGDCLSGDRDTTG